MQILYKKQQGKEPPLRLIIVVQPDAADNMPTSDQQRLHCAVQFASTQKLVVIATLTHVLSFLELLAASATRA
jgi:hypothetical protein